MTPSNVRWALGPRALRWGVLGAWLLLYGMMLLADGQSLFQGNLLTWGTPGEGTLTRFGAALPALVHEGDWTRLLLSPWLHGSLLGIVLLGLFWWSVSRSVLALAGPARVFLVFVVAGLAGALAHCLAHPDSRYLGAGPFDPLLGLLGAQYALGWRIGGDPGRQARRAALGSLVSIALLMALVWYLTAQGPSETLRAVFGIEACVGGLIGGALAGLALGAERVERSAPLEFAALCLIVGLAGLAGAQAIQAQTTANASDAARFLGALEAAELKAWRLYQQPRHATQEARADLGRRLDELEQHAFLDGAPGASAARAYLGAMRPIATGDLRLPFAVEAQLRTTYRAWVDGYERRLRLENGLSTARANRWGGP